MKFMFMNSLQMVAFCKMHRQFSDQYGYHLTKSLPDLYKKIMNPEIQSKEDQLFSTNMIASINKQTGLIDPRVYFKILGNDKFVSTFGLYAIFVIILFDNVYNLCGSATIGFALDKSTATLSDLFVVKHLRGKKYGKTLVKLIIRKLTSFKNIKKILLEVDKSNTAAYNLYKKMDFVEIVTFNGNKTRMEYWLL